VTIVFTNPYFYCYIINWQEALSISRDLEYNGDSDLAVKFMKMLLEHNIAQQNPGYGYSEE